MKVPIHTYIDTEDLETFDRYVKEKKAPNRAEAQRFFIKKGIQFVSLLEIYNNPEQREKFEEKLKSMVKEQALEMTVETMEVSEIDAALLILANTKEKKVRQMILDVRNR